MSQPRRRRRRRGGPGRGGAGGVANTQAQNDARAAGGGQSTGGGRRRRRRRGTRAPQAATLESILASFRTPADVSLTAEPDGQDLDEIIGELQSKWGVPQYPQEYRITIKVAEERTDRGERGNGNGDGNGNGSAPRRGPSGAVREKAPAVPRVASSEDKAAGDDGSKPRKRRRRGRRRRRGGGEAGGGS